MSGPSSRGGALPLRRAWPLASALAVLVLQPAGPAAAVEAGRIEAPASAGQPYRYRPKLLVPDTIKPFLGELGHGSDMFPDERVAGELIARLRALSARLREGPERAAGVADLLLAPSFRGARLGPLEEDAVAAGPGLRVLRARRLSPEPVLDAAAFTRELRRQLEEFRGVAVAELLLTSLDLDRERGLATTDVRYDLAGPGRAAWRVERLGVWRLVWRRDAAGWRVVDWRAVEALRSSAPFPVFSEVTTAAIGGNDSFRRQLAVGFDAWAGALDSSFARDSNGHHGVAVGDADGDGLDDVYVAQPHGLPNRLYRARGDGTFEDATERSGVGILEDTQQALFADVDNDADQDLIVGTSSGPLLFLNDGKGGYARQPGAFRFEKGLLGAPMSMALADYDRDGLLDLYLCVYSFYYGAGEAQAGTPTPYHDATNGPANVLFRNAGGGSFVEVTREAGLDAGNDRFTFAAAWGDYDGDGWPDLVVANDFGRKNLYHNLGRREGRVTFEDVAAQAGVEDHAAGMSVLFFDYDGDGRPDIYGGQMWSDNGVRLTASAAFMPQAPEDVRALYRRHARGNSLFRNRGDGRFEDVSLPARANMGRWSWSTGALDFDCDGWDDLYAVNGMVTRDSSDEDLDWFFWGGIVARSPLTRATGTPYDDAWRVMNTVMAGRSVAGHQRDVFLRNDGAGGFDDVSGAVGLDLDQDGRAFGVLDLDGDGDPDLVVLAPRAAPQLRVFRNDFRGRGATLAVRLAGTTGNRDAIGARVTVETDVLRRTKTVQAGSGFLSQHSKELLFGLGPSSRVARLTVDWPDGTRQSFADLPLERRVTIEQGREPRADPYRRLQPLAVDATPPMPGVAPPGTWLYEPFPAPDVAFTDLRGAERSLAGLRGRPAVLLFWATQAAPSAAALTALAAGGPALAEAGVGVLALALDPASSLDRVRAAAASAGTLPVALAGDDAARSYAILHRYLFTGRPDLELPTTFLLDGDGRIVKVYRAGVDVAALVRDASRIAASPAERLARALPFEGAFYSAPGRRDYVPYGRELLDQGLQSAAVVAFEEAAKGSPSASILYRLGNLLVRTGQSAKARAAYERALAMQPDLAEASNDLGTLLAEGGDLPAAIARFRAALATTPEYPDALNNLGYALLLTGEPSQARELYDDGRWRSSPTSRRRSTTSA